MFERYQQTCLNTSLQIWIVLLHKSHPLPPLQTDNKPFELRLKVLKFRCVVVINKLVTCDCKPVTIVLQPCFVLLYKPHPLLPLQLPTPSVIQKFKRHFLENQPRFKDFVHKLFCSKFYKQQFVLYTKVSLDYVFVR